MYVCMYVCMPLTGVRVASSLTLKCKPHTPQHTAIHYIGTPHLSFSNIKPKTLSHKP